MNGSKRRDDDIENVEREDESKKRAEENPNAEALQITRRKRRKQQDNYIENFVRENASMLAKQAEKKPNAANKFKCHDCGKEYNSHQALGGHRAAHKSYKVQTGANRGYESDQTTSQPKLHYCKKCNKGFDIGQALGGHMRMHWKKPSKNEKKTSITKLKNFNNDEDIVKEENAGTTIVVKLFTDEDFVKEESLNTGLVLYHHGECSYSSSASTSNLHGKGVFEFDLNLTPEQNESLNDD